MGANASASQESERRKSAEADAERSRQLFVGLAARRAQEAQQRSAASPLTAALQRRSASFSAPLPELPGGGKGGLERRASADGGEAGGGEASTNTRDASPPRSPRAQPQSPCALPQQATPTSDDGDDPALDELVARFEWGRALGVGGYSYVVAAVERRSGRAVAVKCVPRDGLAGRGSQPSPEDAAPASESAAAEAAAAAQELEAQIEREVALQRECASAHVLAVRDFVRTRQLLVIVTDLCKGDLLDTLVEEIEAGEYSERRVAGIVRAVAAALRACHARGVAHLDVKPGNVLLAAEDRASFDAAEGDEGSRVRLADFGMAARVPVQRSVGTPMFVAPEVLTEGVAGTEADMWALGVLTYILLVGFSPWAGARRAADLPRLITTAAYSFDAPAFDHVSAAAKRFVAALLRLRPADRLAAADVATHPWILAATARCVARARAQAALA